MAGKPGRSGGARPGSGRKPSEPKLKTSKQYETDDPIEFLRAVMKDPTVDFAKRQDAATKLAQLEARGAPDPGKKGARKKAAEEVVGTGRFAPIPPPRAKPALTVVGGKAEAA